jgi:hypothetical protein
MRQQKIGNVINISGKQEARSSSNDLKSEPEVRIATISVNHNNALTKVSAKPRKFQTSSAGDDCGSKIHNLFHVNEIQQIHAFAHCLTPV